MFTDQDYQEYFEEIIIKEKEMFYNIRKIIYSINDRNIVRILKSISADESDHFSYIKELSEFLFSKKEGERRKYVRKHALGNIRIKDLSNNLEFSAVFLNFSEGGVCLESEQALILQDSYELWLDVSGMNEPIHRTGKLVWSFEIKPNLYVGGIHFEP